MDDNMRWAESTLAKISRSPHRTVNLIMAKEKAEDVIRNYLYFLKDIEKGRPVARK